MCARIFSMCIVLVLAAGLVGGCAAPATATVTPAVPTATSTPAAPVTADSPYRLPSTPDEVQARLPGLDFDRFLDVSYNLLLLRDPEGITELGLAEKLGVDNSQLTNVSVEYGLQTLDMAAEILALLQSYDTSKFNAEQKLSYDVYQWYLMDLTAGREYFLDDYAISQWVDSPQNRLTRLFNDVQPMNNLEDAQAYLQRLVGIPAKFEQLCASVQQRQTAGVILPRGLLSALIAELNQIAGSAATSTSFYQAIASKLGALSLTAEQSAGLLQNAQDAVSNAVLPAYKTLAQCLQAQLPQAGNDIGVSRYANGADYYAYLLRHHTTTDRSADDIYAMGLGEVERLKGEMQAAFERLGYPKGASLADQFNRVAQDSGFISGEQTRAYYEQLLQAADARLSEVFDLRPSSKVVVIADPAGGGYYMPPAADGSRPGAFYADLSSRLPKYNQPTLLYHETIPGHHYQIALAQTLPLPFVRKVLSFNAYVEGWALYAEQLASEMGFYQDDPYGDLGRLQFAAYRAARLVVDTGIHSQGWSHEQAVQYFMEATGFSRGMAENQVSRYIIMPAQATSYYIGFLKLLDLRDRAQNQLGSRFDIKQYHNAVLSEGSLPLGILEQSVKTKLGLK